MLVADGVRHRAADDCVDPLAEPLSREIATLLSGLW